MAGHAGDDSAGCRSFGGRAVAQTHTGPGKGAARAAAGAAHKLVVPAMAEACCGSALARRKSTTALIFTPRGRLGWACRLRCFQSAPAGAPDAVEASPEAVEAALRAPRPAVALPPRPPRPAADAREGRWCALQRQQARQGKPGRPRCHHQHQPAPAPAPLPPALAPPPCCPPCALASLASRSCRSSASVAMDALFLCLKFASKASTRDMVPAAAPLTARAGRQERVGRGSGAERAARACVWGNRGGNCGCAPGSEITPMQSYVDNATRFYSFKGEATGTPRYTAVPHGIAAQ